MTRRSALLLARLALAHERTLSRAAAAESLWPEDYYDATRVRLRQELARLRKTLGDASDILEIDGDDIRLSTSVEVDLDSVRSALRVARQSSSAEERMTLFESALLMSEGALMSGADEAWVQAERTKVSNDRYEALLELSDFRRGIPDFEGALKLARRAISIDPHREEARLLAGQALADLGHTADAMLELGAIRRPETQKSQGAGGTDFTPKAVRPLRFSVPHPTEAIYGREKELEAIRRQLMPKAGKPRLVTLLGPGGIGKSRLLLEAAAQSSGMYGGLIAHIDLSELHDARLVPLAILRALRADSIPTDNPAERLSAVLPTVPMVLALDNLEHLGARMQVFVRRLLERHPELRIIVTSRVALGVGGEHRIQLDPLPVPSASSKVTEEESPALRMFVHLATANGVELEADSHVRSIVRRLEGVPLAILLAAGRLRTLGAQELDHQLEASFDVLATGRAGVAERHRSMRRVVEGSFKSLSPELQHVLCALAIFRGGWTLDAATRVCQLEDSLDAMEALLDSSLVYVDQEGRNIRFRMLESIRSYALTQIEEETLAAVRIAHANWISDLADSVAIEYATADDIRGFDVVEAEWDNVRGALDYALDEDPGLAFHFGASLAFYWRCRSNGFEAFKFYEELFDRYGDLASSSDAARAAFGQVLVFQIIDYGDRPEELKRAMELCRTAELYPLCAKIEVMRGMRTQNRQKYEESALHFENAEVLVAMGGSECDRAYIAMHKGYGKYFQGDPIAAVELLRASVESLGSHGELFHQFRSRQLLALAAMDALRLDIAEQALDGLVEGVRQARFVPMLALAYNTQGKLAFRQGHFESAREWFTFSHADWSERQVPWQMYEQEFWLGRSYLGSKDFSSAETMIRRAVVHWYDFGAHTAAAMGMFGLAEVLLRTDRPGPAAATLNCAQRSISQTKSRILASEIAYCNELELELKNLGIVLPADDELDFDSLISSYREPDAAV